MDLPFTEPNSPWRRELSVALAVVQASALIAEELVGPGNQDIVDKTDMTPVTVADFAIQALVASTIRQAFPNDTILGEENADELRSNPALLERVYNIVDKITARYLFMRDDAADDLDMNFACDPVRRPRSKDDVLDLIDMCGNAEPLMGRRTWIVDPIDGTKSFIKGELYAINIALVVDGLQVVACVASPNMQWPPLNVTGGSDLPGPLLNNAVQSNDNFTKLEGKDLCGRGCIFFARHDVEGAWVLPLAVRSTLKGNNRPSQFYAPPVQLAHLNSEYLPTTADLRFVTCSEVASGLTSIHETVMTQLATKHREPSDIVSWVLRWATLALGRANAVVWVYKKRGGAKTWDHAGAMLLFEKVGGKITDVEGQGINLMAGRKYAQNWGFVGAPEHLHTALLETVQEALWQTGVSMT